MWGISEYRADSFWMLNCAKLCTKFFLLLVIQLDHVFVMISLGSLYGWIYWYLPMVFSVFVSNKIIWELDHISRIIPNITHEVSVTLSSLLFHPIPEFWLFKIIYHVYCVTKKISKIYYIMRSIFILFISFNCKLIVILFCLLSRKCWYFCLSPSFLTSPTFFPQFFPHYYMVNSLLEISSSRYELSNVFVWGAKTFVCQRLFLLLF